MILRSLVDQEADHRQLSVYVPEAFNAAAHVGHDQALIDIANWRVAESYRRSQYGDRIDDYHSMSAKYLRQVIPWRIEKKLDECLSDVLESDNHYLPGIKSIGYRLTQGYRRSPWKLVPILSPKILPRIRGLYMRAASALRPVHWHLLNCFARLKIDVSTRSKANSYHLLPIHELHSVQWFPTVCPYGRFHTPLTRLKRQYRQGLRIDGQPVVELDIRNSQPLFLAPLLRHHFAEALPHDVALYVDLVQQGEFYEYIAQHTSATRDRIKKQLFRHAFYCKNEHDSPLRQLFGQLFPSVDAFMRKVKQKDYRQLARDMQQAESKLMIDGVCARLMKEYPTIPILTIHDSILTTQEHSTTVRQIIVEEFAKVGVNPSIK